MTTTTDGSVLRWSALVLALLAGASCGSARSPAGPETAVDAADEEPEPPVTRPVRTDAAGRPDPEPPTGTGGGSGPVDAAEADARVADSAPFADLAGPVGPAADGASGPTAPSACPGLTGGWMEYQPEKSLQFEGSSGSTTGITSHPAGMTLSDDHCTYSDSGGVELFRMTKNPAGVRQRCEMRVKNGYRTGSNQFEGDVRVTAGDGTCVHQVFKFLMLVAYPQNGGELHQHSQAFLASGVFGKWVHVNTVHDTAAGKVDIYLDCVKKLTINQSPPDAADGWYNKYGVYNLGGAVAQSEWRNVRFYRR
jgi:hypothetical protein